MGAFKTRAGWLTASLTPNAEGNRGGFLGLGGELGIS